MRATTITLTEQELNFLRVIAQQTGKTPEELVRDAVIQFLAQYQPLTAGHYSNKRVACGRIALICRHSPISGVKWTVGSSHDDNCRRSFID